MKATAKGKVTRDDQLSCSQLPALMGESPWQTPNDILARCFDAILGNPPEDIGNESMEWGSRLELPILEEAAARLGMDLLHGFTTPFQAPDLPLACSLDGVVNSRFEHNVLKTDPEAGIFVMTDDGTLEVSTDGILEAKLTATPPDDTPPLYRGPLQLQGQMICTGKSWGAIATLHRGTELRIHVFPAHQGTQDAIRQVAKDFEGRLIAFGTHGVKEWYPVKTPEDGANTYSDARPITVKLEDEDVKWVEQLRQGKELVRQGEDLHAEATAALMNRMGDAQQAIVGGYTLTWGSRSYKAQPEKIVPAKEAYTVRSKTLTVKDAA